MEHFTAIIDSIAWPATIFVIFYLLRNRIRDLLSFVSNVKYKGFEVSFRERLREARAEAELSNIEYNLPPEIKEKIYKLVEISPSSAILESWKEIELAANQKVTELVNAKGVLSKAQKHPLQHLEFVGALIPSTVRAIGDLRVLRNQVAHVRDGAVLIRTLCLSN